ncbi:MAG: hypothetical protein A2827_01110 [Candidatus Spechtbacteria bacterium RIFCSPHIGHO2_01_FULL_43_30]|uniref:Cohesin domain-containing protein n=1 Tax=Candidatus Spechtbacteria bacterium RIFCSPHIGHO2_01_FULL_43_30 TaxID=1802158 RepID=A0A1G2H501_9BACT|nr:MAG: hypothetical protein A2827_01110 [Candidatus Spechtbacteria bacterium RIFCSPHIGHO2_01_FULL_43_30]
MKHKIFLLVIVLILLAPANARAAVLYFKPNQSSQNLGDTFIQEIRLNTEGEFINTAEIYIEYPQDILELADFSNGNSVLSLWIENPEVKNGFIHFIAGVPAGYQGSDGFVAKMIFFTKTSSIQSDTANADALLGTIRFSESSKILLNDGVGTLANVEFESANVVIIPKLLSKVEDEWHDEIMLDSTSPEPFIVSVSKHKDIFGGKYFISFSTVDKQTGIDHYEVFEYFDGKVSETKNAASPYLLDNQELNGIIRVRAVDKRGNEAISEIRLNNELESKTQNRISKTAIPVFIFSVLLVCASAIAIYAKKSRKK